MEMATEARLKELASAVETNNDMQAVVDEIWSLQTADKYRLAAMLLDKGLPRLAATIGRRATAEVDKVMGGYGAQGIG